MSYGSNIYVCPNQLTGVKLQQFFILDQDDVEFKLESGHSDCESKINYVEDIKRGTYLMQI